MIYNILLTLLLCFCLSPCKGQVVCKYRIIMPTRVLSDQIWTVIIFYNTSTVNTALYQIKQYLDMAVMPQCLRRLEVLRYKRPLGQSQTINTQFVVHMFREVIMWDFRPQDIMAMCLLNTIQDKSMMIKFQE